jgi:hypothetical protein
MAKRQINPQTGKPFKFGDIREDGFIFRQWGKIRADGYQQPLWMSPEAFARNREKCKSDHKIKTKKLRNWLNKLKIFYGCAVCGYNKIAEGLDFDHLRDKNFNIGGETKTSKQRVLKEISKCQILCGTCHHIKTRAPIIYQELRKECGKEKEINLELFLKHQDEHSHPLGQKP